MAYIMPSQNGIYIADGESRYRIKPPIFSLWNYRNLRKRSVIVGLVGPRGSGKSVGGDRLVILDFMLRGKTAWSNIDIQFDLIGQDGIIVPMRSNPLDRISLTDMDRIYSDGVIFFDEVNVNYAESRRSMSKDNLAFSYITQQLRKRRLDIIWTAQSEEHCDARLRFQTDIFIQCQDMSISKTKCGVGELSAWKAHDYSGVVKGKSPKTSEDAIFYRGVEWNKPWWNTFDTWKIQDDDSAQEANGDAVDTQAEEIAAQIADFMRESAAKVKCRELWHRFGVNTRKMQVRIGQILHQEHNIHKEFDLPQSRYYVLEGAE